MNPRPINPPPEVIMFDVESMAARESAVLGHARRIALAFSDVPSLERVPPETIDQARTSLRRLGALLSEIETDAQNRMTIVREVRDELTALLYSRAERLTVESIAADAGVGPTQVRRVAAQHGALTRRPRRRLKIPSGTGQVRAVTVDSVTDSHENGQEDAPDAPHAARVYYYYLGGKGPFHFAVDRAAAAAFRKTHPHLPLIARQNRAFLVRAVRHLARAGITQYIDIGTGIPCEPNVHEVARAVHADARVLYSDNDPFVLSVGSKILSSTPGVAMMYGDLRYIDDILGSVHTNTLLDLSRPVAILLVSVLHYIDDDEAAHTIDRLRKSLPVGSYLVISHISTPDLAERATELARGTQQFNARTPDQIGAWLDGMDIEQPGIVPLTRWRPDTPRLAETIPAKQVPFTVAVARQTTRRPEDAT